MESNIGGIYQEVNELRDKVSRSQRIKGESINKSKSKWRKYQEVKE